MSDSTTTEEVTITTVRNEVANGVTVLRAVLLREERERADIEDIRAIRRNRNRLVTLLFTIVIGAVVTYLLSNRVLGQAGYDFYPYSFVITVVMDLGLTGYAFIRRY